MLYCVELFVHGTCWCCCGILSVTLGPTFKLKDCVTVNLLFLGAALTVFCHLSFPVSCDLNALVLSSYTFNPLLPGVA